jgi:hypothetical protein
MSISKKNLCECGHLPDDHIVDTLYGNGKLQCWHILHKKTGCFKDFCNCVEYNPSPQQVIH